MTTADTDPFGLSDTPPVSHRGTVSRETLHKPLDLHIALQFLALVHPHPQTYILEGPDRRRGRGIWHPGKQVQSTRDLEEKISELQRNFRTIQFTPNIIQGTRRNSDVTHLNCIYSDVDKDVPAQEVALAELAARYDFHWHIKISTRPGKYQYFWLLNPVLQNPSTRGKYNQVAEEIRSVIRDPGTTSTDISHLMRVPGCIAYREEGNFYTELLDFNTQLPRYSLEELSSKFPPRPFDTRYTIPKEHSITDNRNNSLRDCLAHFCKFNPTVEDLELVQKGFIEYAIHPEHRTRDGFQEEIKDMPRRTYERLVLPSITVAAQANFKIKPDETLRETHPEEFYLGLPGGIGDVVRYLSQHAPHIPPACHFASAYGLLSTIAAYSVKDIHGNTPTTYIGVVAKSGTGKTVPLSNIRKALISGGFSPELFFSSDGASDMGMVKLLQKFGGVGCMHTEEAYDFLNSRTSKQTASHALGIFTWLLKFHSAHSDLGVTRGPSLKEIERNEGKENSLDSLDCPRLSWVYGIQPDFFKEHFLDDKYLVTQGFAGRILNIITHGARFSGNQPQLTTEHSNKIWEMISPYPCVEAALTLQYATYGLLPTDPEFTPVGPQSDTVIVVPPEHVHLNGHTNGHTNGHATNDELALDVVPPHMENKSKRGRGRPKKVSAYGFLPTKPEPIITRSTPEVVTLGYSPVGQGLLDEFSSYCRLRSEGTAASANIWARGLDQAIRISIGMRAFGTDEIEAITSAIEFVRGSFLGIDTAYHSNNADRAEGRNTDFRKRVYEVMVKLKETTQSVLINKVSKNVQYYRTIKEIIRTEVEAGYLVAAPGSTNGIKLRLIDVPPEYKDL